MIPGSLLWQVERDRLLEITSFSRPGALSALEATPPAVRGLVAGAN